MLGSLVCLDEKRVAEFRRVFVVGDLHGDYRSLCLLLESVDLSVDGLVFLGDYADRGCFGLEVVKKVANLARENPNRVFLLKGNHEDYTKGGVPRFWPCEFCEEVVRKRGSWQSFFKDEFSGFLELLNLAVIFEGWLLFVHGGVSSKIDGLWKLANPSREVELDVLWSDPFDGVGERVNLKRRGVGVEFGVDITRKVCEQLGVLKIIRSHQPRKAAEGPFFEHEKKVVTVNSSSMYGGTPFVLSLDPCEPAGFEVVRLN